MTISNVGVHQIWQLKPKSPPNVPHIQYAISTYLLLYHSNCTSYIPYHGKVWRVESLANLVNRLQFAKLKLVTISNPLANLFI